MRNAAMLNGRITVEQMEWLQQKADDLGGNLSAALRQALTDARLLEMAREDYKSIRAEHPDWDIPNHTDDGTTRALTTVLVFELTESTDVELRALEADADQRSGDGS